jgi:Amt family ammonium transporter
VGTVVLNTHLAAAAGASGAMLALLASGRPILLTQVVNGSIGGLVAITAGAASMEPLFAAITGLVAGPVVVFGADLLLRLRLDDVVGAVPVHGFAGAWGTLAAGLFYQGDLFSAERVLVQFIGIAFAFLWAFGTALLLYFLVQRTVGLRADPLHEQRGLDYTEHAEVGYPEFQDDPIPDRDARPEAV